MKLNLISMVAVVAGVLLSLHAMAAESPKTPVAGDKAPSFEGKDQDGRIIKSEDFLAKKNVLLYFYPKDDTPGCTKQACGLRDRITDLKKQDIEVIGVSFDPAESHKNFISKFGLNFPLIADTEGKIADAYGARKEAGKNMSRRVSFLIGKDGKIVHVTDTPSADVHLNEMKEAAGKLVSK